MVVVVVMDLQQQMHWLEMLVVLIHPKEILVDTEDIMVVATMLLVVVEELVVMVVTKFQMDLATIGML